MLVELLFTLVTSELPLLLMLRAEHEAPAFLLFVRPDLALLIVPAVLPVMSCTEAKHQKKTPDYSNYFLFFLFNIKLSVKRRFIKLLAHHVSHGHI